MSSAYESLMNAAKSAKNGTSASTSVPTNKITQSGSNTNNTIALNSNTNNNTSTYDKLMLKASVAKSGVNANTIAKNSYSNPQYEKKTRYDNAKKAKEDYEKKYFTSGTSSNYYKSSKEYKALTKELEEASKDYKLYEDNLYDADKTLKRINDEVNYYTSQLYDLEDKAKKATTQAEFDKIKSEYDKTYTAYENSLSGYNYFLDRMSDSGWTEELSQRYSGKTKLERKLMNVADTVVGGTDQILAGLGTTSVKSILDLPYRASNYLQNSLTGKEKTLIEQFNLDHSNAFNYTDSKSFLSSIDSRKISQEEWDKMSFRDKEKYYSIGYESLEEINNALSKAGDKILRFNIKSNNAEIRREETIKPMIELQQKGDERLSRMSYGLGEFESQVVNSLSSATGQAADIVLSSLYSPGTGLGSMMLRVFGNSYNSSIADGASDTRATVRGVVDAAIEYFAEQIGDSAGLSRLVYGKGATKKIVDEVMKKLPNNLLGKAGRYVISKTAGAISEGFEEDISEFLSPFSEAILETDYFKAVKEKYDEKTAKDYADAFAGGAIMSLFGSTVANVGSVATSFGSSNFTRTLNKNLYEASTWNHIRETLPEDSKNIVERAIERNIKHSEPVSELEQLIERTRQEFAQGKNIALNGNNDVGNGLGLEYAKSLLVKDYNEYKDIFDTAEPGTVLMDTDGNIVATVEYRNENGDLVLLYSDEKYAQPVRFIIPYKKFNRFSEIGQRLYSHLKNGATFVNETAKAEEDNVPFVNNVKADTEKIPTENRAFHNINTFDDMEDRKHTPSKRELTTKDYDYAWNKLNENGIDHTSEVTIHNYKSLDGDILCDIGEWELFTLDEVISLYGNKNNNEPAGYDADVSRKHYTDNYKDKISSPSKSLRKLNNYILISKKLKEIKSIAKEEKKTNGKISEDTQKEIDIYETLLEYKELSKIEAITALKEVMQSIYVDTNSGIKYNKNGDIELSTYNMNDISNALLSDIDDSKKDYINEAIRILEDKYNLSTKNIFLELSKTNDNELRIEKLKKEITELEKNELLESEESPELAKRLRSLKEELKVLEEKEFKKEYGDEITDEIYGETVNIKYSRKESSDKHLDEQSSDSDYEKERTFRNEQLKRDSEKTKGASATNEYNKSWYTNNIDLEVGESNKYFKERHAKDFPHKINNTNKDNFFLSTKHKSTFKYKGKIYNTVEEAINDNLETKYKYIYNGKEYTSIEQIYAFNKKDEIKDEDIKVKEYKKDIDGYNIVNILKAKFSTDSNLKKLMSLPKYTEFNIPYGKHIKTVFESLRNEHRVDENLSKKNWEVKQAEKRAKEYAESLKDKLQFEPFKNDKYIDRQAAEISKITNKFIGFGLKGDATEYYREQAGDKANSGDYSSEDVIYVSVPGRQGDYKLRREAQNATIEEVIKALESGATIITHTKDFVSKSTFNEGEQRLFKTLEEKGYKYYNRTLRDGSRCGRWVKEATTESKANNSNKIDSFRNQNSFLSNMSDSAIEYNGITYNSAEAAFQAQKFSRESDKRRISKMSAKDAKAEGKKAKLPDDWESTKLDIMEDILRAKFEQNIDLSYMLQQTGEKELIEGNNWNDSFWGVSNGIGRNELGKILIKIRKELMSSDNTNFKNNKKYTEGNNMTFKYEGHKNPDVKSNTTFDAILEGKRTSTSRLLSWGKSSFEKYSNLKPGDIVVWNDGNGRKLTTIIEDVSQLEWHNTFGNNGYVTDDYGDTVDPIKWSKEEGWDVEYGWSKYIENPLKTGDKVVQIKFRLIDSGNTQNNTKESNINSEDEVFEVKKAYRQNNILSNNNPNVPKANGIGKEYTNHSGGADGSDSHWGKVGNTLGVKSNHYYYGEKTAKNMNYEISEEDYKEGLVHVNKAAETLGKNPKNPKTLALLSRNWQQVKNSDAIFAIGELNSWSTVSGGTGWAVQMAIDDADNKQRPIYVFAQSQNKWYSYDYSLGKFREYKGVPQLTKNFAGIGTRNLKPNGERAIWDVYHTSIRPSSSNVKSRPSNYIYESSLREEDYGINTDTENVNDEYIESTGKQYKTEDEMWDDITMSEDEIFDEEYESYNNQEPTAYATDGDKLTDDFINDTVDNLYQLGIKNGVEINFRGLKIKEENGYVVARDSEGNIKYRYQITENTKDDGYRKLASDLFYDNSGFNYKNYMRDFYRIKDIVVDPFNDKQIRNVYEDASEFVPDLSYTITSRNGDAYEVDTWINENGDAMYSLYKAGTDELVREYNISQNSENMIWFNTMAGDLNRFLNGYSQYDTKRALEEKGIEGKNKKKSKKESKNEYVIPPEKFYDENGILQETSSATISEDELNGVLNDIYENREEYGGNNNDQAESRTKRYRPESGNERTDNDNNRRKRRTSNSTNDIKFFEGTEYNGRKVTTTISEDGTRSQIIEVDDRGNTNHIKIDNGGIVEKESLDNDVRDILDNTDSDLVVSIPISASNMTNEEGVSLGGVQYSGKDGYTIIFKNDSVIDSTNNEVKISSKSVLLHEHGHLISRASTAEQIKNAILNFCKNFSSKPEQLLKSWENKLRESKSYKNAKPWYIYSEIFTRILTQNNIGTFDFSDSRIDFLSQEDVQRIIIDGCCDIYGKERGKEIAQKYLNTFEKHIMETLPRNQSDKIKKERARAQSEREFNQTFQEESIKVKEAVKGITKSVDFLSSEDSYLNLGDLNNGKRNNFDKSVGILTNIKNIAAGIVNGTNSVSDLNEAYLHAADNEFTRFFTSSHVKAQMDKAYKAEQEYYSLPDNSPDKNKARANYVKQTRRALEMMSKDIKDMDRAYKDMVAIKDLSNAKGVKVSDKAIAKILSYYVRMQISTGNVFRALGGFRKFENNIGYRLQEEHDRAIAVRIATEVEAKSIFKGMELSNDFLDDKPLTLNGKELEVDGCKIGIQTGLAIKKSLETLGAGYDDKGNFHSSQRVESLKGFAVNKGEFIELGNVDVQELYDSITEALPEDAKVYEKAANEMFASFNPMMKEAYMRAYGTDINMFDDGKYYPIEYRSPMDTNWDSQWRLTKDNTQLVLDEDAMHERSKTEGGYVYAVPINQTVDNYIQSASNYVAFAEYSKYINNINRDNKFVPSLGRSLGHVYGKQGTEWANEYIKDISLERDNLDEGLNNGVNRAFRWGRQNIARGALGLSLSVPMKQISSYWAACGVLSPKSLLQAYKINPGNPKNAHFQLEARYNGGIDPTIADAMKMNKFMRNSKALQKVNSLIPTMDAWTVSRLYSACVIEMESIYGDTKTEAQMQELIDDKFNEVVLNTQPIYVTQARPEYSRTDSEFIKAISMFRTQQTQNLNRIITSIGEYMAYKNDVSHSKEVTQAMQKTLGGQLASYMSLAILTILSDLALHRQKKFEDDEGEIDFSKVLERFFLNAIESGASTAFLGDQLAKITIDKIKQAKGEESSEYYGLPLGIISSIESANEALGWFLETPNLSNARYAAGYIANIFGIPINNAYQILNSVVMYATDIGMDISNQKAFSGNVGNYDDVLKLIDNNIKGNNDTQKKFLAIKAVNSYNEGYTKLADNAYKRFESEFREEETEKENKEKAQESFKNYIKNSYLDEKIDAITASKLLTTYGGVKTSDKALEKVQDWRDNTDYSKFKEEYPDLELSKSEYLYYEKNFKESMDAEEYASMVEDLDELKSSRADNYDSSYNADIVSKITSTNASTEVKNELIEKYTTQNYRRVYNPLISAGMSSNEAAQVFNSIDEDANGSVKQDEMISWYKKNKSEANKKALLEIAEAMGWSSEQWKKKLRSVGIT